MIAYFAEHFFLLQKLMKIVHSLIQLKDKPAAKMNESVLAQQTRPPESESVSTFRKKMNSNVLRNSRRFKL